MRVGSNGINAADPITVRCADDRDLPTLNRVMHASSAYGGDYRRILDGYDVTVDQVARDQVWVAESNGDILGFYSLVIQGTPERDLMFVADAAQGLGLGAASFRAHDRHCRAARCHFGEDRLPSAGGRLLRENEREDYRESATFGPRVVAEAPARSAYQELQRKY